MKSFKEFHNMLNEDPVADDSVRDGLKNYDTKKINAAIVEFQRFSGNPKTFVAEYIKKHPVEAGATAAENEIEKPSKGVAAKEKPLDSSENQLGGGDIPRIDFIKNNYTKALETLNTISKLINYNYSALDTVSLKGSIGTIDGFLTSFNDNIVKKLKSKIPFSLILNSVLSGAHIENYGERLQSVINEIIPEGSEAEKNVLLSELNNILVAYQKFETLLKDKKLNGTKAVEQLITKSKEEISDLSKKYDKPVEETPLTPINNKTTKVSQEENTPVTGQVGGETGSKTEAGGSPGDSGGSPGGGESNSSTPAAKIPFTQRAYEELIDTLATTAINDITKRFNLKPSLLKPSLSESIKNKNKIIKEMFNSTHKNGEETDAYIKKSRRAYEDISGKINKAKQEAEAVFAREFIKIDGNLTSGEKINIKVKIANALSNFKIKVEKAKASIGKDLTQNAVGIVAGGILGLPGAGLDKFNKWAKGTQEQQEKRAATDEEHADWEKNAAKTNSEDNIINLKNEIEDQKTKVDGCTTPETELTETRKLAALEKTLERIEGRHNAKYSPENKISEAIKDKIKEAPAPEANKEKTSKAQAQVKETIKDGFEKQIEGFLDSKKITDYGDERMVRNFLGQYTSEKATGGSGVKQNDLQNKISEILKKYGIGADVASNSDENNVGLGKPEAVPLNSGITAQVTGGAGQVAEVPKEVTKKIKKTLDRNGNEITAGSRAPMTTQEGSNRDIRLKGIQAEKEARAFNKEAKKAAFPNATAPLNGALAPVLKTKKELEAEEEEAARSAALTNASNTQSNIRRDASIDTEPKSSLLTKILTNRKDGVEETKKVKEEEYWKKMFRIYGGEPENKNLSLEEFVKKEKRNQDFTNYNNRNLTPEAIRNKNNNYLKYLENARANPGTFGKSKATVDTKQELNKDFEEIKDEFESRLDDFIAKEKEYTKKKILNAIKNKTM